MFIGSRLRQYSGRIVRANRYERRLCYAELRVVPRSERPARLHLHERAHSVAHLTLPPPGPFESVSVVVYGQRPSTLDPRP